MSDLRRFHEEFGELFTKAVDTEGDESEGSERGDDGFNERFGWLYNAKQVADFEGISLWEFWDKDVMSFLNHLVYLRNYNAHMEKLSKDANTKR